MAFVGSDVVYKSQLRLGHSDNPGFVYPSAWVVSLRASVRSSDGQWGVTAFLFNPAFPNGHVGGISGWNSAQALREVGLSLELRF